MPPLVVLCLAAPWLRLQGKCRHRCWPCNNRKGSKLLSSADLGMSLRRPARKPTSGEHITMHHTVPDEAREEATSPLAYRRTWRKYLLPESNAM